MPVWLIVTRRVDGLAQAGRAASARRTGTRPAFLFLTNFDSSLTMKLRPVLFLSLSVLAAFLTAIDSLMDAVRSCGLAPPVEVTS